MRSDRGYRQRSAMSFDDQPANCQPHPHAIGFRREERIKDTVESFWCMPVPESSTVTSMPLGLNGFDPIRNVRSVTVRMASAALVTRFTMTSCSWPQGKAEGDLSLPRPSDGSQFSAGGAAAEERVAAVRLES